MKITALPDIFDLKVERDAEIESVGKIQHERPNMLVFVEHERYLDAAINGENVSFVVTTPDLGPEVPQPIGLATTERPRESFIRLHNYLATETDFYGAHFENDIHPTAEIHPKAILADKGIRIGERSRIAAGAVIREGSIIGRAVRIGENSVIGAEGFEFQEVAGDLVRVEQVGGVELEDEVEVQSCTCVDRALFGGATKLGFQTKVDNLVHIAHDVVTGKRCKIVAGAMVAGNVVLGDGVWVGPMASISNSLVVEDGGAVTLGSVATKSVNAGTTVTGNFAIDHSRFIEFIKSIS